MTTSDGVPWLGYELPLPAGIALVLASTVVAGLVFGPGSLRRLLSFAACLLGLVGALLLPRDEALARALIATLSGLPLLKWVDGIRSRPALGAKERLWDFLAPFDITEVKRAAPVWSGRDIAAAAGFGVLAIGGAALVLAAAPTYEGLARFLLRWAGGVVLVYCAVEAITRTIRIGYAGAGMVIPRIQNHPILSRTATEFWAERWNHPVHQWLYRHCFRPLARRRLPRLGAFIAFVVSALLHLWIVYVPLGLEAALIMAAFFVVQGLIVIVEGAVRARRFSRPAGHAWGAMVLLGPSPLFIDPFVRILEG